MEHWIFTLQDIFFFCRNLAVAVKSMVEGALSSVSYRKKAGKADRQNPFPQELFPSYISPARRPAGSPSSAFGGSLQMMDILAVWYSS